MLYQFIRQLEHRARAGLLDPQGVHVLVFDKQPVAGPGFPHNDRFVQPYHITNMCAGDMSVIYSDPLDFSDWVKSRHADLANRFPAFRSIIYDPAYHQNGCSHYPRALMGEYLAARFQDALKAANKLGVKVDVHTGCEITNIAEAERGLSLRARFCDSGSELDFATDHALLATGHWRRSGSSGAGYFPSPWPAHRLLVEIPPGAGVAVIGSSLSAIETALTLTSDGRFMRTASGGLRFEPSPETRRITLMSRHGMLPRVRAGCLDYHPRFFNRKNLLELLTKHPGNLSLDAIFVLLDQELSVATGQSLEWGNIVSPRESPMEGLENSLRQACSPGDRGGGALWQSILREVLPLVRELYLALSAAERRRFDQDYATLFFAHAATQPPVNAEKLLALMRAGVLEVVALGHNYRFAETSAEAGYEFVYGIGAQRVMTFRYVVDARGQERSVTTDPSRLTANLIQNRMIHLGEVTENSEKAEAAALSADEAGKHRIESVCIDPESHRVMRLSPSGIISKSGNLYAVGAMTRGQIIDVSMARGLTRSTDRIAHQLADWLAGRRQYPRTETDDSPSPF